MLPSGSTTRRGSLKVIQMAKLKHYHSADGTPCKASDIIVDTLQKRVYKVGDNGELNTTPMIVNPEEVGRYHCNSCSISFTDWRTTEVHLNVAYNCRDYEDS